MASAAALAVRIASAADPSLGKRALSFLASQAKAPEAEVRAASAAAWGLIGNKAALPILKAGLKDSDDSVKLEAAASLHKLGDLSGVAVIEAVVARSPGAAKAKPSPAEELKERARDKIRAAAALRLADMGSVSVVRLLEKTLKSDRSALVRDAAAISLCRMGLDEEGGFADRFLNAFGDEDEFTRAEAVKSLGLTRAEVAVEALKDAAADSSPLVRAEAMTALASFPSPQTRGLLEFGLLDEQPRVRLTAARALAALADPASAEALRPHLKAEADKALQLASAMALAKLGEKIDLTLAKRMLDSADEEARDLAVETIAASGSDESYPLLSRVMDDDASARLRVKAAMSIVIKMMPASPGAAQDQPPAGGRPLSTPLPQKPTAAPMPQPAPGSKPTPKGLPGLGEKR